MCRDKNKQKIIAKLYSLFHNHCVLKSSGITTKIYLRKIVTDEPDCEKVTYIMEYMCSLYY